MIAITLQVTKNGYLVTEASVNSSGTVVENMNPVRHVFANIEDLSFWLTGHLDVPVGEA